MINSKRAKPTPSQGIADNPRASSGLPTFIRIWGVGSGNLAQFRLDDFKWQQAIINSSDVTLSAGNSDRLPCCDRTGSITTTDNRGDTHFSGNNRRMTGSSTLVGDNCACLFHNRLPVRIGFICDQYFSRLEFGDLIAFAALKSQCVSACHGTGCHRLAAFFRAIMVRNFSAHCGRSSCFERSSAKLPAATSLVMTEPDPM